MGQIPPRISTGDNPDLFKIGALPFQRLVRDLVSFEPGVITASVFGISGDSQDGIDVVVRTVAGPLHVAQCKCYPTIDPAEVRDAAAEFWKYLDRWLEKGVDRFLLATTADCSRRSVRDAIDIQVKQFAEKSIRFEVWDLSELVARMRPHRGIVSTYFASAADWIQVICGPDADAAALLNARLEYEVAAARGLIRQGHWVAASEWYEATVADETLLNAISNESRAQLAFFGVQLALRGGLIELAESRFKQGEKFVPSDVRARALARIAAQERDIPYAIRLLSEYFDRDSRTLLAELMFNSSDIAGASAALADDAATIEPDADAHRIRSKIAFVSGEAELAAREQQLAEAKGPNYESVRAWGAELAYYSGLAIGVTEKTLVAYPQPVPRSLVRSDTLSSLGFRSAASVFKQLARNYATASPMWRMYSTWALASLANDLSRPNDATEYAREIFGKDGRNAWALEWVLEERVSLDIDEIRDELLKEYESGDVSFDDGLLLATIEQRRSCENALQVMEVIRPKITSSDEQIRWAVEYAHCRLQVGKGIDVDSLGDGLPDEHMSYLREFVRVAQRDTQQTNEAFKKQAEEGNPASLYFYADSLVKEENWVALRELEKGLLALGTHNALGFAVAAAYYGNDLRHALQLIDECGPKLIESGLLPSSLRRTRAQVQHALGNLPEAIADMDAVCHDDNRTSNLLLLGSFLAQLGDTKRLGVVARDLSDRDDLDARGALTVARYIQFDDPIAARTLWLGHGLTVPDTLVIESLLLAYALKLDDETKPLIERLSALAEVRGSGVERFNTEAAIEKAKGVRRTFTQLGEMYARGETTAYAVSSQSNVPLIEMYHAQLEDKVRRDGVRLFPPLFIRHGGRSLRATFDLDADARLYIDLSSLLLANYLGILDKVEAAFATLVISRYLPQALQVMIEQAGPAQPALMSMYEGIAERRADGTISLESPQMRPAPKATLAEILAALYTAGEISRDEQDAALIGWADGVSRSVKRGEWVCLDLPTLGALYDAGLLDVTTTTFGVTVFPEDEATLRDSISTMRRRIRNQGLLRTLRDRIARGIKRKHYCYAEEPATELAAAEASQSPNDAMLASLFRLIPQAGDAIWVDDRALNAFPHRDGVPILTIVEVLQALERRQQLSRRAFFDALLRLRKADARFIPLLPSEIVYWLSVAPATVEGRVEETSALGALSRYVQRVREDSSLLQPGTGTALGSGDVHVRSASPPGEAEYIAQLDAALDTAIADLRRSSESNSSEAKVEWIMRRLAAS